MRNLMTCLLAAAMMGGCVSAGKGRDEQMVRQTLAEWEAAVVAKDVSALMTVYSENYKSSQAGSKKAQQRILQEFFDAGYLDNAKVHMDDAEIECSGGTAKVKGVQIETATGPYTLTFTFVNEDGTWRIIDSLYY